MFVDVGAWRRWTILVDALDTFFFSRMQGELLVGKLVVTGQEAVEGSMQGMRADLYKKHIRQIRLRRGYALAWWNCVVGWRQNSTSSCASMGSLLTVWKARSDEPLKSLCVHDL